MVLYLEEDKALISQITGIMHKNDYSCVSGRILFYINLGKTK